MKTRIILNSFNALSFAVVPVSRPDVGQEGAGAEPLGHVVPHSLQEWFAGGGALEICGTVAPESADMPGLELLGEQLARSQRCPSRHLRLAPAFEGDRRPVQGWSSL
jgi:hypothetical protein